MEIPILIFDDFEWTGLNPYWQFSGKQETIYDKIDK